MDAIFGHEAAELIRVRKLSSDELRAKEVRDHPELPGVKEHQQFLTLVEDAEEEEQQEELDRLYSAAKKEKKARGKDKGKDEAKKGENQEGDKEQKDVKDKKAALEKDAKKAMSDASAKIKWALGLSDHLREAVKSDFDTKKKVLEAKAWGSLCMKSLLVLAGDFNFGPLERDVTEKLASGESRGCTGPWTEKLASYAPGNASRDFKRNEPVMVEVAAKVETGSTDSGRMNLPVILPYDVMDYLIGSCHLPIDDLLLNKFWSHLDSVQDPWALSTSDFRKAAGANVIPLGFYGDEACIGLVTDPYNQIYGSLAEADSIEQAGKTFLLAYRHNRLLRQCFGEEVRRKRGDVYSFMGYIFSK
ncbi:Uncharacterized protein SCF082_LOCUS49697 [Durusdinium trenchii]|uniref:Uncharacterized protein n=1 Tax=Durusdinium trenchii TaxID=1381693 RepID=A0ABP0S2Z1_9DINO